MSVSYEKTIKLNSSLDDIDKIIELTLEELGWCYSKPENNRYESKIEINFKTWGERFTIIVLQNDLLNVRSCLNFGIVDWGKNQENVELFEGSLKKTMSSAIIRNNSTEVKSDNESEFVAKISKFHKLRTADIITEEEHLELKNNAISQFVTQADVPDVESLLICLCKLSENGSLTKEDLIKIKLKLTN